MLGQNPGIDAATLDAMRHRFGLDQPWYWQYLLYIKNLALHLDFGESFTRHQPVFVVLREALGNTLLLASASALVTWGLAIPLGVWAAARRGQAVDRVVGLAAGAGLAVPEILSGLLLLLMAAHTGWFPVGGMHSAGLGSDGRGRASVGISHGTWRCRRWWWARCRSRRACARCAPACSTCSGWTTSRRRARAASREPAVLYRHALRNALNPMITLFGLTLGALVSGSFVAEVVFSWPGLGRVTLEALLAEDPYLVMGALLMSTAVLAAGNLVGDVLLASR